MPLINGGVGRVLSATPPPDSDGDGMPDAWETARGLNKNSATDATTYSTTNPGYLNIEVYVNSLGTSSGLVVQSNKETSRPVHAVAVK